MRKSSRLGVGIEAEERDQSWGLRGRAGEGMLGPCTRAEGGRLESGWWRGRMEPKGTGAFGAEGLVQSRWVARGEMDGEMMEWQGRNGKNYLEDNNQIVVEDDHLSWG